MKYFLFLILFTVVAQVGNSQSGHDIYINYCIACHDQKLEGGRAPSLLEAKWKYGQSKKAMRKSISEGIPGTEMMPWKNMLTDKQIDTVEDNLISLKRKKG
ncbi:MAG: c-type cytochrome [Chitinophagaceae bacterium]